MKKLHLIFIGLLLFSSKLNSQSSQNYYVSSQVLNVREATDKKAKIVTKLKLHDNLKLIEKDSTKWVKISFESYKGYVYSDYIKKGKAVIATYSVRTGARCRDGSSSSATGRGACSHHGGVSRWITRERKSVRIQN